MISSAIRGMILYAACLALPGVSFGLVQDPAIDALKDRLPHAPPQDRSNLCLQIAHLQLMQAAAFYTNNDPQKAEAALADVAQYSERGGNAAIQSRSHEKQTEISIRRMIRRLADLKHEAVREDQPAIQSAIDKLERVRDSLLAAMFPKTPVPPRQ